MTVFKWSKTAASNATADSSINAREGQAPSTINDAIRGVMAAVAKWRDDLSGNLVTAGTSTAYTLATNQSYMALADGISVRARLNATSGAAPTLNVDGTGAKAIASVYGTAISTGALLSGGVYEFVYDSTDDKWIVVGIVVQPIALGGTGATTAAAAATALGLGTGDSPQFTAINLGHASDTTLTRTGSGDIAIEGNAIYRAGGTDVPIADGGTGASTAANARTNLELGTIATQAANNVAITGGSVYGTITRATEQATTSGTNFDFTSIPSGVKRITVLFNGVSLSGNDTLLVQVGDTGGIETTGYTSLSMSLEDASDVNEPSTSTAGFVIRSTRASETVIGRIVLENISGNIWIGTHSVYLDAGRVAVGSGTKTLSDTLDRVRITRSGSNTFDAGSVNIFYE